MIDKKPVSVEEQIQMLEEQTDVFIEKTKIVAKIVEDYSEELHRLRQMTNENQKALYILRNKK